MSAQKEMSDHRVVRALRDRLEPRELKVKLGPQVPSDPLGKKGISEIRDRLVHKAPRVKKVKSALLVLERKETKARSARLGHREPWDRRVALAHREPKAIKAKSEVREPAVIKEARAMSAHRD